MNGIGPPRSNSYGLNPFIQRMHRTFLRKRWSALDTTRVPEAPEPGTILQEIGSQLALFLAIALLAYLVFGVP